MHATSCAPRLLRCPAEPPPEIPRERGSDWTSGLPATHADRRWDEMRQTLPAWNMRKRSMSGKITKQNAPTVRSIRKSCTAHSSDSSAGSARASVFLAEGRELPTRRLEKNSPRIHSSRFFFRQPVRCTFSRRVIFHFYSLKIKMRNITVIV